MPHKTASMTPTPEGMAGTYGRICGSTEAAGIAKHRRDHRSRRRHLRKTERQTQAPTRTNGQTTAARTTQGTTTGRR